MRVRGGNAVWLVAGLLVFGAVACGGETSTSDPDTNVDDDTGGGDVGGDVGEEDTGGEDTGGNDTGGEDAEDDSGGEDTVEDTGGPCGAETFCIDERTGRPRAAICDEAGYPDDTRCVAQSAEVACCVAPFACETDEDCVNNREAEGFCHDERFPCVCNVPTGECFLSLCSSDAECGDGEICADGICETAPGAEGYVARILTPSGFVGPDSTRELLAVAVLESDPTVTNTSLTIEWSVDSETSGSVSAEGVLTTTDTAGAIVVTATVADNSSDPGDTATFTNVGTPGTEIV